MKTSERKVKVFQLVRNSFDADGYLLPMAERTSKVLCIGTVILPNKEGEFDNEIVWHLFNWTCWRERDRRGAINKRGFRYDGCRFLPNKNARGYCNSDIFFKIGDQWQVADHCGWSSVATYDEAVARCLENQRY